MHAKKRKEKITAKGPKDKTTVMGLLSRHSGRDDGSASQLVARVVATTKRKDLIKIIREHVEAGAEIHSDTHPTYGKLHEEDVHKVVNHAEYYVKERPHERLENFWCLLKRSLKGTYVSVEPFHLCRYLDEQVYRFNERKDDDQGRFVQAMGTVKDRRLTYKKPHQAGLTARLGLLLWMFAARYDLAHCDHECRRRRFPVTHMRHLFRPSSSVWYLFGHGVPGLTDSILSAKVKKENTGKLGLAAGNRAPSLPDALRSRY